jgi:hypothetical protein
MKVAALAALSVLVVLPAEAGQRHRTNVSPKVTCDNDGHCTTFAAAAPVASPHRSRAKVQSAITAAPAAGAAATPAATSKTAPTAEARDATVAAATDPTAGDPTAAASGATTVTDGAITAPVPVPAPKPRAAGLDGNGNAAGIIISSKTGARARVGVAYAARFQAYIDDLENNHGARVLFMGGIRPGRCRPASQHPCGKALDVCQLGWGRVDPRCKLPDRVALGRIAAAHSLFEGGRWCHSDYGHAQISVTAAACGDGPFRIVRRTEPAPVVDEPRP